MRWRVLLIIAALAAGPASAGDILAARTLRPGVIVAPGDLRAAEGAAPGASARIAELEGLEVKAAIYAGRPVPRGALGPPTLVARNDVVVMEYRSGGLSLRTEGRALDAGAEGARIRVMNLASRITVTAVVTGPDRVRVTP